MRLASHCVDLSHSIYMRMHVHACVRIDLLAVRMVLELRFRQNQKVEMEELAPKATGREAMQEKRAARRLEVRCSPFWWV